MPALSRMTRRRLAAGTALATVGLLTLTATAASAGATSARVGGSTTLTSDVVKDLSSYQRLGAAPADARMHVAVALTLDQAARDAAYTAMYDPKSPSFHQFMTPQEFNARFAVNRDVAATVSDRVTSAGLTVDYTSPDGSYLLLSGTSRQVEKTFAVHENRYQKAGAAAAFVANDVAPTVPAGVAAVLGLTSLTRYQTNSRVVAPAQGTCRATMCVGGLTPQDLWSDYDQPAGDRGAGKSIAIFGEGQLDQVVKDLRQFETTNKLPTVPVRRILVGDDNTDNAGQDEWDLDSQSSTGMSPDAQSLDFYFGSDLSDASIGATYSAWVNDTSGTAADTGNSSFGGAEQFEYLGGFILDPILQQGAMEGRTMFVSSGDGGGSCLPGANGVVNDQVPCVEYPASSPYVVGVGGSVLYSQATLPPTGSTASTQVSPAARNLEYAWTFSGGGQSEFEPAPSYQSADFPGTAVPCAAGPSQGKPCRGVPDVAAVSGDGVNGYTTVVSGTATTISGTSLSSPLWAGMWTRILAAHPATGCATTYTGGKAAIGFAQPVFYAMAADAALLPKVFFDIGGTTMSQPTGNEQQVAIGRNAVDPSGYDYVNGLGTPMSINQMAVALDCTTTPVPTQQNVVPASNDVTIIPTLTGCGINGILNPPDRAGDEVPATATNAALDLTTVRLTSDATSTTFTAVVSNLAGNPAEDLDYAFEFNYNNTKYAVAADRGVSANAFSLYRRTIMVTATGIGVEQPPTDLSDALTGSIGAAATPNVITVTMPFSLFNSAAKPSVAYGVGSTLSAITIYTGAGPATTAIPNAYNAAPTDQAEYLQCPYVIGGATLATPPAPTLPETPVALLLPLAALGLVGGTAVVRRRRRIA